MSRKHNILCVDDERFNLDALRRTLRREYQVFTASSGDEALAMMEQGDISLIITDQRMPQMTGVQFLEKTIEKYPNTIRIILTGYTDVEDLIGSINTGRVYRYIVKPWDNEELKMTVRRALEAYDLTVENLRLLEDLRIQAEKERRIRTIFQRYTPETVINEVLNPVHDELLMGNTEGVQDAFERMLYDLEEKQRIDEELKYAMEIQQRLLPQEMPDIPGLEIAAMNQPARNVGGDFYDFVPLGKNLMAVVIADVSGKGMPAALLMATARAMLRAQLAFLPVGVSAAEATDVIPYMLDRVNNSLCKDTEPHRFVVLLYGILNLPARTFTYINAGHHTQWLHHTNGGITQELDKGGIMVGAIEDMMYEKETVQLAPGDVIFLYTDGITDALNAREEEFGQARLLGLVQQNAHLNAQALMEIVHREVTEFSADAPQFDDMTLVVLKLRESETGGGALSRKP